MLNRIKNFVRRRLAKFVFGYDKKLVRSPFFFIHRQNYTNNQDYWDEYRQPLRHLIGVEIGVYKGDHSAQLMNGFLNIKKLYLVDPWVTYIDEGSNANAMGLSKESWDNVYKEVVNKFKDNNKVEIIRDFSAKAALRFPDNYFDFVYLDGDHSYQGALEDLKTYYPKLKKYGVMCGDDFGNPPGFGVVKAVTEFAYEKKVLVMWGTEDNQFWFMKTE